MKYLFLLFIFMAGKVSLPLNETGDYQLLTIAPSNKHPILVRCNTKTGESFHRLSGKWLKGVDADPIELSDYVCAIQSFGDGGWTLVRMDKNTGKIWTLQGEVWRVVLDEKATNRQN